MVVAVERTSTNEEERGDLQETRRVSGPHIYAQETEGCRSEQLDVTKLGSAQEFVGRAGIAEFGLNSQFADG
jgi:hypothetical protein